MPPKEEKQEQIIGRLEAANSEADAKTADLVGQLNTAAEEISRLQVENTELQTQLQEQIEKTSDQALQAQQLVHQLTEAEQKTVVLNDAIETLKQAMNEIEISAADEIQALSEQLQSATVNIDSSKPIINHEGVDYVIIGKSWQINKRTVKIEDLRNDSALFASLIAKRVGFIRAKK